MTLPTSRTPARMPAVAPAKTSPTPQRVTLSSLLPRTPAEEYVQALADAGWKFDISAVALVKGVRTAKLESLKHDIQLWLANQRQYPSATLLDALQADVMRLAAERLPKTNGLLQ